MAQNYQREIIGNTVRSSKIWGGITLKEIVSAKHISGLYDKNKGSKKRFSKSNQDNSSCMSIATRSGS